MRKDKSDWPNIRKFLAHIFGDEETGIDYIKNLYHNPKQPRVVLVLFSNGIAGKTTFIRILKLIMGDNMRIEDGRGYKRSISSVPIVAIDDLIKPVDLSCGASTVIITTTRQRVLVDNWIQDIGARVLTVTDLKHKRPIDFAAMYNEVPSFIEYLKKNRATFKNNHKNKEYTWKNSLRQSTISSMSISVIDVSMNAVSAEPPGANGSTAVN